MHVNIPPRLSLFVCLLFTVYCMQLPVWYVCFAWLLFALPPYLTACIYCMCMWVCVCVCVCVCVDTCLYLVSCTAVHWCLSTTDAAGVWAVCVPPSSLLSKGKTFSIILQDSFEHSSVQVGCVLPWTPETTCPGRQHLDISDSSTYSHVRVLHHPCYV